jgi:hypothetical protein
VVVVVVVAVAEARLDVLYPHVADRLDCRPDYPNQMMTMTLCARRAHPFTVEQQQQQQL